MSYTKRRCNKCGFTDIQPNMKQIEVEYEVGSSSAAISKRSFFTALLFDDKSAQRQNTNWLTGNTKRKYKRKRRVWVCGNGCNHKPQTSTVHIQQSKKKSRAEITKIAEIEGTCKAKQFFDAVRELDSAERTIAELELIIAYGDYLERMTASWYIRFAKWLWKAAKVTFIASSFCLWVLLLINLNK
jgi:hypothetical protein